MQKSWGCLRIIFLIICSAVTVRENRHRLIAVLIGCVKWAWRAPGSPIPISRITSTVHVNWQALLTAETRQCAALAFEQCFHAGFASCQSSLGKCCSNSTQSFLIPLLLCRCYVPKNILCFMGIGMVSFLLSHFSTSTVILFHYLAALQPEWNQCLFHLVCMMRLGTKCLWLG